MFIDSKRSIGLGTTKEHGVRHRSHLEISRGSRCFVVPAPLSGDRNRGGADNRAGSACAAGV